VDPVTEQVVKSNDPYGDEGLVCVRDMARVGVKHRMAKMFLILVFSHIVTLKLFFYSTFKATISQATLKLGQLSVYILEKQ
jgi:hypothetical protein